MIVRKKQLIIAILILIALVAVLTNPGEEKHKEKVKEVLAQQMQQTIQNELFDSNPNLNLNAEQEILLQKTLTDQLVNSVVKTTDFILFSTTNLRWRGESSVVGFGMFGHVFVSPKVKDKLDQSILESY